MHLRQRVAALVLATATLAPAAARAQSSDADRATARELTLEGYKALEQKDYVTAADRFARADSLFHAATITLGLARARAGLGKLVSAQELYSKVIHEPVPPNAPAAFMKAIEEAKAEYAALAPRMPTVVIVVKGSDAPRVTLDGVVVPVAALGVKRPVDPGKHVIRADAAGFATGEVTVTVAEGKTETATVELKPGVGPALPPEPPGPSVDPKAGPPLVVAPPPGGNEAPDSSGSLRKTLGFVGIGIGGAGLILGGAMGGVAAGKHSDLIKSCPDGHCPKGSESTFQSKVDSYNTMGTVSTIGFIAGGVFAATGVVLVITAPKSKAATSARVSPVVGPSFLGAEGSF